MRRPRQAPRRSPARRGRAPPRSGDRSPHAEGRSVPRRSPRRAPAPRGCARGTPRRSPRNPSRCPNKGCSSGLPPGSARGTARTGATRSPPHARACRPRWRCQARGLKAPSRSSRISPRGLRTCTRTSASGTRRRSARWSAEAPERAVSGASSRRQCRPRGCRSRPVRRRAPTGARGSRRPCPWCGPAAMPGRSAGQRGGSPCNHVPRRSCRRFSWRYGAASSVPRGRMRASSRWLRHMRRWPGVVFRRPRARQGAYPPCRRASRRRCG